MLHQHCPMTTRDGARRENKITEFASSFEQLFLQFVSGHFASQSPEVEGTRLCPSSRFAIARCEASLEHAGLY